MSKPLQSTTTPQCVLVCEYNACLSRHGEIDPYFISFIQTCIADQYQVYVIGEVSEQKIQSIIGTIEHGIHIIGKHSTLIGESCECLAKVCIRNVVLPAITEDAMVLSVCSTAYGCCIARFSDVVFARDEAAAYCNAEKIPHYPYATMFDVKRIFTSKVMNGKVHARNKARLLRKEAFETE